MKITLHTPTSNINDSVNFYSKLKYHDISKNKLHGFTDGNAVIEINEDRYVRPGIKLYQENWDALVKELSKVVTIHEVTDGHLLCDGNGCWIYLSKSEYPFEDTHDLKPALPGNFAGVSLESAEPEKSIALWNVLGFKKTMGDMEHGYVVLENEVGFKVSIMKPLVCPHLFFNPSFTYFNGGNNLENISAIRKTGIPFVEEITHFNKEGIVDNIIIRDPGGYGFFIFND